MRFHNLLLSILFITIISCNVTEVKKNDVAVSILPQKFIVDRITNKGLSVMVMVPPGQSPSTYEMTVRSARKLSGVKIYLKIGHIIFEKSQWKSIQSMNTSMKSYDVSRGVNLIRGTRDHHHGEIDPHLWLSPLAMKIVAARTYEALSEIKPDEKSNYKKNYEKLLKEIDLLNKDLQEKLSQYKGNTLMVFHPAWGYFARDYKLTQLAIEHEGKEPGAQKMKELIDKAQNAQVKAILIQKQFPKDVAQSIANDLKIKIIQVDPLSYNWFNTMKDIQRAVTGQ